MKSFVKLFLGFLIIWAVVFGLCFSAGLFENTFQYLVAPFILAVVITCGLLVGASKKDVARSTAKTQMSKRAKPSTLYVCRHLSSSILYDVIGNKVYEHLTTKPIYEIKENKVYRVGCAKPILVIKGKLLFEPSNPKTKYRVEGNKIYEGNFGRVPILSLRNAQDKFNQTK